jgi:hypothetical protein
VSRAPREQSGDEAARPAAAPVGARFGLALFGVLTSVVGMLLLGAARSWWGVVLFGVIAGVALVDATIQGRRIARRRRSRG